MPRAETFTVNGSLCIEAQHTDNGWQFYAWRPHTSQFFADAQALLRWAKWPTKTPTGDALRQWLSSLQASATPAPEPVAHATAPGSFDPLATLDHDDPNHQTRTVI
jgi:hypothetical protein